MDLKKCMKYSLSFTKYWLKSLSIQNKIQLKQCSTKMGSPARDQFIVGSPHNDIIVPKKTFTELIWEQHIKWSNKKAVVCGLTNEEYTFSELKEHSTLIGGSLINEGLSSEEVLALLLPNSPQYISIILGASERGLIICSINPLYTIDEITQQIKHSGAKNIITFPEKVQDVIKAVDNLRAAKCLPPNFKVFCTKLFHQNNTTIPSNVICLNDLVNKLKVTTNNNPLIATENINENSLAVISHSSGTTGLPKGVCLTHKNFTASVLQMAQKPTSVFNETNDNHQDVIPMVLPIFHNYALAMTIYGLYHGSRIVTLPKFEERTYLSVLKKHKATILFVVPPIILFLGSNPTVTKDHLQNVRLMFTAAAPVGVDEIVKCLKKTPRDVNFVQAYGQTEATCCLTHTPYGHTNYRSVGVPLANTDMKVIDLQTGKSKGPNEEGEFCFKGPQMTPGYLNNPEANKETIDDEGWFHTGDIGYYDEDGFFYVVDRIKEMIKVKGFQVAPAELEQLLRSFPGIEAAGVIGVPNTRKGEVPIAFIKKKEGSTVDGRSLHEFLASKVAKFKLIEKYIFVDSIPTSASGKILRKELKKIYMSEN